MQQLSGTDYWNETNAPSATTTINNDNNDNNSNGNSNNNNNDDDDDDMPNVLPESTAYWSKPPYAWSSSFNYVPPRLTSSHCAKALHSLFHNTYYDSSVADPSIPNFLLAVVVESSSHPAGLNALYAQPYVYAGPGLGNMDECPLQSCIAGGRSTDSFTFASLCIVPECSAYDVAAEDFTSVADRQLIQPKDYYFGDNDDDITSLQESKRLGHEYVQLVQTISEINRFLDGGWTCGNFIVPWTPVNTIFCTILLTLLLGLPLSSWWWRRHRLGVPCAHNNRITPSSTVSSSSSSSYRRSDINIITSAGDNEDMESDPIQPETDNEPLMIQKEPPTQHETESVEDWSTIWDVSRHFQSLIAPSKIPCIDGLRVGSMVWIILGHVMAIQSSMGAGYANPSNFLPPTGWTTTWIGQLLFSCRLAVDTFLVISGYLVVQVLNAKLHIPSNTLVVLFYVRQLPTILLGRVVRILPLYATSLGLYTLVAPHLGSGPFWHQWLALLKPCHDNVWTNLLFCNNFWPLNTPTTATCFYHSWYIAVDMQLFAVAPFFVFLFQRNQQSAMRSLWILFLCLVALAAYLGHENHWSINTFDGAAIGRYDVEAYAKPHIRAIAYLAGMFTAMRQINRSASSFRQQIHMTWVHHLLLYGSLVVMGAIAFCTVLGAYARRPCTYKEDPFHNECGSIWSEETTWLYTSFSRPVWCICVSIVLAMSVEERHSIVTNVLSWSCWGPLSRLTFGAYLVHPILIFVWQLGDREKSVFRLLTFAMNYLSVCGVSYVIAFALFLTIELPCAAVWKSMASSMTVSLNLLQRRLALPTTKSNGNASQRHNANYGAIR